MIHSRNPSILCASSLIVHIQTQTDLIYTQTNIKFQMGKNTNRNHYLYN